MVEQRVNTTTGNLIRIIAEGCVERCEARRKKIADQGATEEQISVDLNSITLDYFIGATQCARALNIAELVTHLEHVIMGDISKFGYMNVHKLASKKSLN